MKNKLKTSLHASLWEGSFSSAMTGMIDTFLSPFALAMNANAPQIGILSSIPNLIAALVQSQTFFITRMLRGPKRSILSLTRVQSLVLFLMPTLLFLPEEIRISGLIVLAIVYTTAGGLMLSIWGAIISKYVPLRRRAGYFGWRNQMMGYLIMSGTAVGGIFLWLSSVHKLRGFFALFCVAGVLKLVSLVFSRKIFEPKLKFSASVIPTPESSHRLFDRRLRSYLLFVGFMAFSTSLVGPLFSIHMLKGLHFDYFTYMVLMVAAQFTTFFAMANWGRHADVVGNLKVIQLCSAFLPCLPVVWIFCSWPSYLFLCQIVGGSVWAGYNLCAQNYIFDAMPGSERIQAAATFNMVNGLGIFFGATFGSQLLSILPPLHGFQFFTLIIISSLCRLMVGQLLLPRVREVRTVPSVRLRDLLWSILGIKKIHGLHHHPQRIVIRPMPGI